MITFFSEEDVLKWEHEQTVDKALLYSATHGTITLPVSAEGIGPVPASTPDGIYRLEVETSCGCFTAAARVWLCQPIRVEATHEPTHPDADVIAPECC